MNKKLSRDLDDCTTDIATAGRALLFFLKKLDIDAEITRTLTAPAVQFAFFLQGRHPLSIVNATRKELGLYLLRPEENAKTITNTENSYHLEWAGAPKAEQGKCRAFDLVITKGGLAQWDTRTDTNADKKADYLQAARLGEMLGLKPGADFQNRDFCHFERADGIITDITERTIAVKQIIFGTN